MRVTLHKNKRREAVRDHLNGLIHRLGPGARLPGVRDLCSELDVSLSTVNSALAELETGQRIVRRQGSGIFVAPDLLRRRIALLCAPGYFWQIGPSPFWGILVKSAQERAEKYEEELLIRFAPLSESIDRELEQGRLHGIVGIGLDQETVDSLTARGVPVVAYAGPASYTVGVADGVLVNAGVSALVAQGCRKIALWHGAHHSRMKEPEAFIEALSSHEVPFHPRLVRYTPPTVASQERGYLLAKSVFSEPSEQWPDGIVITDDMLTIGALGALHERGVSLGTQVRLATHANVGSAILLGWEKELTLLEVDPSEIVHTLFSILEAALSGESPRMGGYFVPIRTRLPEKV